MLTTKKDKIIHVKVSQLLETYKPLSPSWGLSAGMLVKKKKQFSEYLKNARQEWQ